MDVFVAREKQLAQLMAALEQALKGYGGVVFITGEAGSGKSELMNRFVAEAKTAHAQLLGTVRGWYAKREGIEPYQPFFEILTILEQEAQARSKVAWLHKWARCFKTAFKQIPAPVKDHAPKMASLIGLDELHVEAVLKLAEMLTKETSTEGRTLVPLRYTERLTRLAGGHPVIVGLDDLHRADAHSCGLLAYLGQQVVTHPILLIGAFRPQDIDPSHPLEELRLELRRAGAVEIPLDALMQHLQAQRTFVNSYLDAAYTPNTLDRAFRSEIVRRTEGNPLFVSELLQLYVERSWIRREGGQWVQAARIGPELPSYPHDLFKLRWRQLLSNDQEILEAAAVEGKQFTLEVVAAALPKPVAQVRKRLDELDMEREWIVPAGTVRFPTRSFNLYRFRHTLYYEFVYARLQLRPSLLTALHGQMGTAKKELWGTHWVEIAPELAEHFKRGNNWPEAQVCYDQVLVDLKRLEDRQRQAEVMLNLADVFRKMGNLESAAKCFRQTVELTRGLDPTLQERASTDLAWTLFELDRFAEAAPLFQEVIVSHRLREEEPSPRLFFGLAIVLLVTRRPEAAGAELKQAMDHEHLDESDLHDAKQWLSKLLQQMPDTPGVVKALQRLEKVVI